MLDTFQASGNGDWPYAYEWRPTVGAQNTRKIATRARSRAQGNVNQGRRSKINRVGVESNTKVSVNRVG